MCVSIDDKRLDAYQQCILKSINPNISIPKTLKEDTRKKN